MKAIAAIAGASLLLTACTTTDPFTGDSKLSNGTVGAGTGALLGGVAGALVSKDKGKGALIGAGIGALAGGGIGTYMDSQESKLREKLAATGVSVTRNGNEIVLNMPGNVTFASESANVSPSFGPVLDSVALVLNEYHKTTVALSGHTDSSGTQLLNQELSQERAQAVADYLAGRGVMPERMSVQGFADSQPVASNATPEGKAQNRRVEIRLAPIT